MERESVNIFAYVPGGLLFGVNRAERLSGKRPQPVSIGKEKA
jgi:hypothetical protein